MARITFSIPAPLAAAATRKAEADRRSLSNYITILVEEDLKAAGTHPTRDAHSFFLAALAADLAAAPELQADLERFRTLWLRDPRAARAALAAARRAA